MISKILRCVVFSLVFSSFLIANSKVTVKDVEYLKGEDFIQLHFITDKIIPIPDDLFYPFEDEGNYRILVMRITEVNFKLTRNVFEFDSSIVDSITINKDHSQHVDVEIRLNKAIYSKINYRVFTNQNGLYIEFPNIKKRLSKNKENNLPRLKNHQRVGKNSGKREIKITPSAHLSGEVGSKILKEVNVKEKDQNRIKFVFQMSGPVTYEVIPIPEAPVRLAIDLKNVRSGKIKRNINHLNVQQLRGGYHNPSTFRLVFDLNYLKGYNVAVKGKTLEVEFFDKAIANKKVIIAKNSANNKISDKKKAPPKKNSKKEIDSTVFLAQNNVTPPSKNPIKLKKKDEFFSEEKARVQENDKNTERIKEDNDMSVSGYGGLSLSKWKGEKFSYRFYETDLKTVLMHFTEYSGKSMVFDEGITGKVTAYMDDIPWDQALDLFLRQNGLASVYEGNIIRIAPINKLKKEAKEMRDLRKSQVEEAEMATVPIKLNYSQANDVKKILDKSLSERGSIIVDQRSNTLVISEVPGNLSTLYRLINVLDTPNLQVTIEAKVIEARSNFTENMGIQWGPNFIADSAYGNQTTLKFPNSIGVFGNQLTSISSPLVGPLGGYAVNLPAAGATSGMAFTFGNVSNTFRLDMAISAMTTKGQARILSSPKITTQNNQEAIINQGYKIPVQTLQNNTVTVRYLPAVLELKVTPLISDDEYIILTVEIKNDAVDFGNLVLGIPPMTTQSSKNTIRIKNGSTLVIGGMYRIENSKTREGVPFFSKIPILGSLFRNSAKQGLSRETLIFITPRIIRN